MKEVFALHIVIMFCCPEVHLGAFFMDKITNTGTKGTLGLMACVAIIVGGMIGSAIFSLSGLSMFTAGPAAIVSWLLAAIIMLIYGLCVAELSTIFPKSGGVFVFPSKALGKTEKQGSFWGWISTWGYINANIVAIAFAAIYVSTYIGAGFGLPDGLQIPLAIISILLCFILNILRISVTGKVNTALVVSLVTALGIFVCVAFFSGEWNSNLLTPFFAQGNSGPAGFLAAVPTAMVGYGSIVAIAFMVGEVKNPNRTVPKSVLIAMAIVACIYIVVILATSGLVSAEFLRDNPNFMFIPLYAAVFTKLTAFPWLAKVVSIAAVLALLTTMLVVIALTSRAIQASAEKKLIPSIFAKNGKTGTPIAASTLVSVLAIIVSCFPSLTQQIVSFAALFAATTISINFVSLLVARKKIPYVEGSFKAPGGKILPIVALALIIICYIPDIITGGWIIWAYTIAWYVVGIAIFYIATKRA